MKEIPVHRRIVLTALMLLGASAFSYSQTLPDTEKGNVILRAFDQYNFGPLFPTYIGHVGIMGEWQGPDSENAADYDVFDMRSTSITVRSTATLTFYNTMVQRRSFWAFTGVNDLLNQSYLSYDGGYVKKMDTFPATSGPPMDPDRRDLIVDGANSWAGTYLTTKFIPFTKVPSTNTFRCDGITEYILERAGVGNGSGFWLLYLESFIASPSVYTFWMVAQREYGTPPITAVTTTGGGTVVANSSISSTTIHVVATEEPTGSGLKSIVLGGPTPSTRPVSGLTANESFSNLADGLYELSAYDLGGNRSKFNFTVSQDEPSQEETDAEERLIPPGGPISSSQCAVGHVAHPYGVGSVNFRELSGPMSSTATFSCLLPDISTSVAYGPFCGLSGGSTYTITACSCAGVCSEEDIPVTTGQYQVSICVASPQATKCASTAATEEQIRASSMTILADWRIKTGGGSWAPEWITPSFGGDAANDGVEWWRGQQGLGVGVGGAVSMNFTVINSTDQGTSLDSVFFQVILGSGPSAKAEFAGDPEFTLAGDGTQVAYGTVTISQVSGQQYPASGGSSSAAATAPFTGPTLSNADCTDDPWWLAALKRLLRFGTSCKTITGSDIVLTSSGSITFHLQDPSGVSVDTTTLHIYRFDGVDWSSSQVTSQLVFKDTTTGVITATGSWIRGGLFAAMFTGQDSSAPATTLSFQGSTHSFLTDIFVATDAYVVLTATDPAVNGYASQLATTYYRLDATTASPAFSVYTSSVPLPLGFHVFEYRSVDWAGNYEPIKTSTFLVTAGSLFRASSRLSSRGSGLMGFLDYGVLLDIQSRAENSLTLQISSPNASPLLSADNIGDIGLGLSQMSARFDVQGGTPTLAALALRSGNSIASTSSVQIAFGYDGEPSMRHAITTTHSTDTVGNRMDFYIWNPLAPSTSSIASMDVLALQASTITSGGVFHVRPVGNAIGGVELIVSDGVTPGGGTVLRADAQTHSARELKSDIRPLTPQERAAAARDALTLKHSRFNYKSEPPGTPPHTGVMHEDAPASVRGPGGSVSLDDRLLNLEVALQETAQRLKRLRERVRRLETP